MDQLVHAIKFHAANLDAASASTEQAIVASYDPAGHRAKVLLNPQGSPGAYTGTLTGWLPIVSPAVGAGWGLQIPLAPGTQVRVSFDGGDAEQGVILGAVHSDAQQPPQAPNAIGTGGTPSTTNAPVTTGEVLLRSQGGIVLRLTPTGVYIAGSVGIDGSLHVNGDVFDQHGSLDRLRRHYDAHTHGGGAIPDAPFQDPE